MIWVNLKRVLKAGFLNFWRNGFVSLASIAVMVVTLFVIGSIILVGALLNTSLEAIKSKVDINVYFVTSAKEDDILHIKKSLESLAEVSRVEYVSRQEVLDNFKKKHQNDQFTLQALEELNDNPLGAILNVKAKDPSQYESIAVFLQGKNILSKEGVSIVDKVNYYQNKVAIDRLSKIIDSADKLGLLITIFLVIISILITFNTIRLAIYISREEISVMRLVGASNKYIRGPFVITGVFYGFISGLITLAIFYPLTYWMGPMTENFFIGMNLFNYYTSNFGQIFLIVLSSGVMIGAISSYLAVKKYLKL